MIELLTTLSRLETLLLLSNWIMGVTLISGLVLILSCVLKNRSAPFRYSLLQMGLLLLLLFLHPVPD